MGEQLGQPQIPDLPEDIVGPIPIFSVLRLIIIVVIVLVLLAVGLKLFLMYRKRGVKTPEIDPITKGRIELSQLYLQFSELSAKELAIRLPRIVKGYLDGRFDLKLTSLTTSELWADQSSWEAKLPGEIAQQLGAHLDLCDAVKFDSVEMAEEIKTQLFESALLGELRPDGSWDLKTFSQKAKP